MQTKFVFTVTDAARFIGKSPVTLRGWERQGLVKLPRDAGGDRRFEVNDVRKVAQVAYRLRRIPKSRLRMVEATLTLLDLLEKENR